MSIDTEPASSRAGTRPGPPPRRRGGIAMLFVLPLVVAVVFAAWALWRANADLDSIEARQLEWATISTLLREHIELTVVSAILVVVIAVPLGIVLTRPASRALAPVAVGVANAGQAAPAIGLLVLLAIWLGFGFGTAVVAP